MTMWMRGACVTVLLSVLGAVAQAEPAKAWSLTPPDGWADHSPTANQQTSVDEMKVKLAAVGGRYDLGLWEGDLGQRLTVLYMVVPGDTEGGPTRVFGWEDGARNGVNGTAKEISYKRTATERLISVDQVSVGFRSVRFVGLDATNALVGIQASCAGPETACGPALASLRLDASTFKKLPKDRASARGNDEASEISYRVGIMVGVALVLIVLVGGIQFARRRSRPST